MLPIGTNRTADDDGVDPTSLMPVEEVLKTHWYAVGRGGKPSHKVTVFRNRKHGKIGPDGKRYFLRGVRTAGGWHYRREDVDAFHRAMNGEPIHAASTATPPESGYATPTQSAETAERELQDAGLL